MAQAVPAAIPLQVPTPPRVLEGLPGEMDKLAPTALNKIDELSGHIWKLAPTAFNEYVRDFWQRSVPARTSLVFMSSRCSDAHAVSLHV